MLFRTSDFWGVCVVRVNIDFFTPVVKRGIIHFFCLGQLNTDLDFDLFFLAHRTANELKVLHTFGSENIKHHWTIIYHISYYKYNNSFLPAQTSSLKLFKGFLGGFNIWTCHKIRLPQNWSLFKYGAESCFLALEELDIGLYCRICFSNLMVLKPCIQSFLLYTRCTHYCSRCWLQE